MKRDASPSGGALEATIRTARNAVFKQLTDTAPRFGIKLHKSTSPRLVTSDEATVAVSAVSDYDPAKLSDGTNAMFIYVDAERRRNAFSIPRGFYVVKAFSRPSEGNPYGLLLDESGTTMAKLGAVLEQKETASDIGISGRIFPSGSGSVTICVSVELNGQEYTVCITVQAER
jgi:hypothetical protein